MTMQLLNLIQGAEVEWKNITEIFKIRNGYTPSKNNLDFWDENLATIPWFRMEDIRANGHILSDSIQHITEKAVKGNLFKANSIIIATSATIGEHALITVDFMCNQRFTCFTISDEYEDKVLPKFAYYYFFSIDKFVQQTQKQSSMPAADMEALKKLEIPIPSLEIQQKVVEILDKMTDYVTELTAELTLRQKQYSYYRDQLLTFPSQSDSDESLTVRWLKMGEFGEFIRGNGMQKKDFVESGFPAIHYGQIYTKYGLTADETFTYVSEDLAKKLRQADNNDLLLATTSENDEDVCKPLAWLGNRAAISGDMMIFRHEQNVKYLAYYIQTEMFQKDKKRKITGTKVRRVSSSDLSNLIIPLPNLTEQKRIVEILDKFDKLTSDLSEGLPCEIKLRQKQYEYWREQLLSFKKE
ncbi:restriction endonuclease subunit S [uncultured Lactococcus sp.]|uniref:restriction endonuclease subunit S n=1 Tax=uncultured Lactococcus sp. TaxID=167973 RepID=UPI0027DD9965|nr:restriction endonuclease subunit S [uncultured Lactococcus sp.]